MAGHPGQSGARIIVTEVPFDRTAAVCERNGVHTSPAMAGKVFELAGARMSAMWHLAVDHETVGPVYAEMRAHHDGPVVISQNLTVFNITDTAVVARQAVEDPCAWPVVGESATTGPR